MPINRATLELFAALDRSAPTPLRTQLEDAICAAITDGGAPPGTKLPASRVLAEALHVSRGVVSEAYAQIAAEGWIEIRRGAAPVVRAAPAAAPDTDGVSPDGRRLARRGSTSPRPRPISPLSRGGRGRRRCGGRSRTCPTRRSTTPTRAATPSCARS